MPARAIGFAITDPAGGVAYYRAAAPAIILHALGDYVVVSDELRMAPDGTFTLGLTSPEGAPPVGWAPDVVVLTGGWPSGLPHVGWIDEARAAGQLVICDVDDYPHVPPDNRHHDPRLAAAKLAAFDRADAVTCSTGVIADWLRMNTTTPVHLVRNVVDPAMYRYARTLNATRRLERAERPVVIGFRGGTAFHQADLEALGGELARLGADVRFRHIGDDPAAPSFAALTGVNPEQVVSVPLVPFRDYPETLAGVDIGILPLADRVFSYAKSGIGALEWTAAGVPWLASPSPEYLRLDKAGCVRRRHQWAGRLADLIRSPELRLEVHLRQRETARRAWENRARAWASVLEQRTAPVEDRGCPPPSADTQSPERNHRRGRA